MRDDTMSLEEELLESLARIGYEIERRLAEPGIAILAAVLLWALWPTPLDALVATCLLALLYYRNTRKRDPPALESGFWPSALGIILVAWGLYSLAWEFLAIPWQVGLILAGLLLIVLGAGGGRGGERGGS